MMAIGDESAVEDPFYRYQMPRLDVKVEGRDKRTVIDNLADVAHALRRDEREIMKSIGKRLATSTKDNYVKGEFSPQMVQNALQAFIINNVLCRSCGLPETMYRASKKRKGVVYIECQACSFTTEKSKF